MGTNIANDFFIKYKDEQLFNDHNSITETFYFFDKNK